MVELTYIVVIMYAFQVQRSQYLYARTIHIPGRKCEEENSKHPLVILITKQYFDLHIHSNHSFDSRVKVSTIFSTALTLALRGVAITDHNTYTQVTSPYDEVLAIPGSEIRIEELFADLLAIGLNEPLRANLDLLETIDAIHDQAAVVIVPHPFSDREFYPAMGERIYDIADRIDGIEVTNPKPFIDNTRARKVANQFQVAKVGGSDAHRVKDIGKGVTVAEHVESVDDLLAAIRSRKTYGLLRNK